MAVPFSPSALAGVPLAHAVRAPEAVALSFEGEGITYAQLAERCDRAAAQLWNVWGVRPGDRVAWLGANHPAQLTLLFALARIGAILLPLNFRLATAEWDAQVRHCGASHLVHDVVWADAAAQLGARHALPVHAAQSLGEGSDALSAPFPGDDASPALLVYTSGTTREPKAALHTQGMLRANMAIAAQVQEMEPHDIVATMLPMFHVGGLCIQTLPALHAGARIVLHPRFTPDAAFDCFERDGPTLTLQVPATMKAMVDHPRWGDANLASLRAVWAGSSLLPAPLVAAFHAKGVPVCNVYGTTETGPFSIALPAAQAASHAGSCGWPAPGVEVKLLDVQGGIGEVLVRGPNVIANYWPDLPARDAQDWFHTGDLASVAQDGSYTLVGRAKDLIISGGENIHPAEIEALLEDHSAVLECAAFGVADDAWGEVVAVAVVLREGHAASQAELESHLAGRIARYKLPRRWFWLDALPKTALGKLQRQALAKLAAPR
ncbi:MAG: AMP-binding protein [Pseudomonadota bacterium]